MGRPPGIAALGAPGAGKAWPAVADHGRELEVGIGGDQARQVELGHGDLLAMQAVGNLDGGPAPGREVLLKPVQVYAALAPGPHDLDHDHAARGSVRSRGGSRHAVRGGLR